MDKIIFHDLVKTPLKERKKLKEFLLSLFINENTIINRIDIVFCTDEYLLNFNRDFLNHDYFTDTISFTLSSADQPVIGELYLSKDRIIENAKNNQLSFYEELTRVIIHSCLHLCGYNDKKQEDFLKMNKKQESYLRKWLVSRET